MKKPFDLSPDADILGLSLFLGDAEIIESCLKDEKTQKKYSKETLIEAAEYLKKYNEKILRKKLEVK